MKTLRLVLIGMATAAMTASISAQTVEFVIVQWKENTKQIGDGASNVVSASATPYYFGASVQGTTGDPVTAGTFSSVTLGLTDGNVGPSLAFDSNDGDWRYESSGYSSMANLLAAFPTSGSFGYAMNLNGTGTLNNNGSTALPTSIPFTAVPDLSTSILAEPLMTLTGGTWQSNGSYLVNDVNSPVTIAFNQVYTGTLGSESFHFDVWVGGPGTVNLSGGVTEGFINVDPTGGTPESAVPTLTIAGGQLVDGNTYTLEVNYAQIMSSNTALSTAFVAAIAEIQTMITITTPLAAVPEPATYVLLGGLAALLGAMVIRRRRV